MKIWLAPLHGITTAVFRKTLSDHVGGIDAAITPFLPVLPAERIKTTSWKGILPENDDRKWETIPQLMGNVVSHFIDTAQALNDRGYPSVNWNLGCPMRRVARRQRGCGLMPHPEIIENVLRQMARENRPLSLKIRLGFHHREEGRRLLEICDHYPLDFIAIHPRLGEWQYEGTPDWDEFEYLVSRSRHRIFYNGDILIPGDLQGLSARFPMIHDWMIGRGLLRNPFLAEEIKGRVLDPALRRQRFIDYYDALVSAFQERRGGDSLLPILKEWWHYFCSFWNMPPETLHSLLRINALPLFQEEINKNVFFR